MMQANQSIAAAPSSQTPASLGIVRSVPRVLALLAVAGSCVAQEVPIRGGSQPAGVPQPTPPVPTQPEATKPQIPQTAETPKADNDEEDDRSNPVREVRVFRVNGTDTQATSADVSNSPALAAWGLDRNRLNPLEMKVRLVVKNGIITRPPRDSNTPRRPLKELISESRQGGAGQLWRIRERALVSLVAPTLLSKDPSPADARAAYLDRAVRIWLLDEFGADLGDQPVELTQDPDGDVTLVIPPPGRGDLDAGDRDSMPRLTETGETRPLKGEVIARISGLFRAEAIGRVAFLPYRADPERPSALVSEGDAFEGIDPSIMSGNDAMLVQAKLFETESGFIAARPGMSGPAIRLVRLAELPQLRSSDGKPARFYASALNAFAEAVAAKYFDRGYRGLLVARIGEPPEDREMLSPIVNAPGERALIYRVAFARVGGVRTVVRSGPDTPAQIDPPAQLPIRDRSPVKENGLVNQAALDDYVFRLNRNPSRHVDVALAPSEEGEKVGLDFLVTTSRPWSVYTQLSNTGTRQTTELRERFGLASYNLTGADDTLLLDYVTGDFESVHAVFASYERPFSFNDRIHWRVFGSYSQYDASQVGLGQLSFTGKTAGGGGELTFNFFQKRAGFAEFVAGTRYEHVEVQNNAGTDAANDFFLPYVGLRADNRTETGALSGSLFAEFSQADIGGTDRDRVDELGRFNSDASWELLRGDIDASVYLENLLKPDVIAQGRGTLAHELSLSFRGFGALGDRLPPNYAETAGGFYSVRGYPEAYAVGDVVLTASAEYRFHLPRVLDPYSETGDAVPKLFGKDFNWRPPRPLTRPDWDLVLKAFVDGGAVRNNHRLGFENNTTLLSAGVGMELVLGRNFIARVDWGIILRDDDTGEGRVNSGDSRVHFVITLLF